MRHWILGTIGAASIAAAAWGCGSGKTGGGAGAEGGGGNTPGVASGGGESGSHGAACTLAAQGIEVSGGRGIAPAIVWTGEGFVVAWQEREADEGDIHLAALDADGNKLGEEVIEGGPSASSHPSVHRDGAGLVVLWQDREGAGSVVRGRRATLAGVPEGAAFEVARSGAAESWPVTAASRDRVMVAWMDAGGAQLGFLHSSALESAMSLQEAQFPAVATDGERTALAWAEGDAIAFARPSPGSTALDPITHDGVAAKVTRVALGGDDAFVAWEDTRSGTEQIRAIRISAQDEVSREVLVSQGEGSANWPALAWTGRNLAVAYYQFRGGPSAVFVALLSPDLTPAGVELEVSGDVPARYPALAWTGQELGIAYAVTDQGIRLSRASCR
ncbi:hypothetical protein SOCEGT47_036030 [Sorangium cellulosum]|uniref:Uncharacterized protein n=1 Tax=Sorangium cellulosum TaxID=56 RepID=A0A4P2Q1I5_SORCE|nr:hypothetical protein [Sorangium cellulosum]AUX23084.1 hypothetical protein SOCEGT47_036030 [Sorangium cellulosum]